MDGNFAMLSPTVVVSKKNKIFVFSWQEGRYKQWLGKKVLCSPTILRIAFSVIQVFKTFSEYLSHMQSAVPPHFKISSPVCIRHFLDPHSYKNLIDSSHYLRVPFNSENWNWVFVWPLVSLFYILEYIGGWFIKSLIL